MASFPRNSPPRRRSKLLGLWGGGLTVLLCLMMAAILLAPALGYRPMLIASGSMRPTLEVGDIVVSRSRVAGDLARGDVVTFQSASMGWRLVTHRVVEVDRVGDVVEVRTQGDANTASERWNARRDALVGVEALHLPMGGPWLLHAQSRRLQLVAVLLLGATTLVTWAVSWRRRKQIATKTHQPTHKVQLPADPKHDTTDGALGTRRLPSTPSRNLP